MVDKTVKTGQYIITHMIRLFQRGCNSFMPCFLNTVKPSLLHKLKALKAPVLEVSHTHSVQCLR